MGRQVEETNQRISQMQGNQSQPSQDSVMVAAAGEEAPPENIINKLETRMQVAEEEMEHKLADITNKNTANNTFQQKMQGDIKTLTSDIEKESKNSLQLAHKIEENAKQAARLKINEDLMTKQVAKVEQDLVTVTKRIAKIEQGPQTDKQQKQLTETLQTLEIESLNSKKLGRNLCSVLDLFIFSFTNVHPNSNFNQFKHFIKQKAEDGRNELISITKSINLY